MEDKHDHKALMREALDEYLEPMVRLAGEFAPNRGEAQDLVKRAFVSTYQDMNGDSNGKGSDVDVKDRLYESLVELITDGDIKPSVPARPATPGKLTREFAGRSDSDADLRMLMSRVDGSDVYEVVSELPHEQRLLTLLYYLAGFTQRQVARLTDLTPAQVRRRLGKSRERLQEFIWQQFSSRDRRAVVELQR